MKAMILAAGRGTRMAPLTDNCPKPLLKLIGKPLIQHHIEKLVAAGIRDIVINHAYLGQMIEQALGDGHKLGCSIRYSAETEALETAGGIVQALPLLMDESDSTDKSTEPFLLINGDVWSNWDYAQAFAKSDQIQQRQMAGWLGLIDNPVHNPQGDFELTDSGILGPQAEHQGVTFSGISVLSPALFEGIEPGVRPLAPLLCQAMARQQIIGEPLNADWVDVGTPERLQALEQQLQTSAAGA